MPHQRRSTLARRGGRTRWSRARRPICLASSRPGSMPPMPRSGSRSLKLITGGLRVGASARLAKIALAEMAEGRIEPDEVEEVWHGLAPPYLAAVRLDRGQRAEAGPGRRAGVPPADARAPAGAAGSRRHWMRATYAPNGSGTASACSSSRREAAAGFYSRGRDDISAALPGNRRGDEVRGRARRRTAGHPRGRGGARSPICSSGSTARPSSARSARLPGRRPPLRHVCSRRPRGFCPLPFDDRRARLGAWFDAPGRAAWISLAARLIFDSLETRRRFATTRARRLDRGADAETPRQRLRARASERAVVEMEARSTRRSTRC